MKVRMISLFLLFLLFSVTFFDDVVFSTQNPLGRPPVMTQKGAAYMIWQDFDGWHIRWGSHMATNNFTGEIKVNSGTISQVKELYPFKVQKLYKNTKRKISFNIKDDKTLNGIDFRTDASTITFNLKINGKGCLDCIFIGSTAFNPKKIPFTLIPIKPGLQTNTNSKKREQ